MPDDKSTSDIRDRVRIAAAEDYEIDYLVVKSGVAASRRAGSSCNMATTVRR